MGRRGNPERILDFGPPLETDERPEKSCCDEMNDYAGLNRGIAAGEHWR
jgi:hypothetical protein